MAEEDFNLTANNDSTLPENDASQTDKTPHSSHGWRVLVVVSIIATLFAWFAMVINEYVSFWTGVGGLVLSIVSTILTGKGFWRDLAITCLIACAVLLLVYGIFYWGIKFAIDSI